MQISSQCDRKRKCGHDTAMTNFPDRRETIRLELRQAVFDCRERGLYEAASWAAQHLTSLPASTQPSSTEGVGLPGGEQESDAYLVAKSLFDCKVCLWVVAQHAVQGDAVRNCTLGGQGLARSAMVFTEFCVCSGVSVWWSQPWPLCSMGLCDWLWPAGIPKVLACTEGLLRGERPRQGEVSQVLFSVLGRREETTVRFSTDLNGACWCTTGIAALAPPHDHRTRDMMDLRAVCLAVQ